MTLKNARHERFAQLLAAGRSQSAAYREVYPKSKAWAGEGLHPEASRLAHKVSARLAEIQQEGVSRAILTRNELAEYLSKVILTPVGEVGPDSPLVQDYSTDKSGVHVRMVSKIAAVSELAKLMGWFAPEKVDFTFRFKPDSAVYERLSVAAGGG